MATLEEQLAALKAENDALKTAQAKRNTLTLKVSGKGALSLYGVGRFPASFYRSQWERILDHADEIRKFIAANEKALAVKE